MAERKFVTGVLIQDKEGNKGIFEYTYAAAFGGKDSNSISIAWVDEKGKILHSSAWHRKSHFEVLESDVEDNMKKLRAYHKKQGGAPIFMKASLAKDLGYTSIHTYESAKLGKKNGFIKL